MQMAGEMQRMARWNRWANRVVGEVLIAAGGNPEPALRAFQHIFETEVTWLRRFDGSNAEMVPLWKSASLENALGLQREADDLLSALTARLDDARLLQTFEYANSSGRRFTDRIQEPLLHMFLHSQQYRGEAAAFLNAAGHTVPDFDFIFWLRQGEPE